MYGEQTTGSEPNGLTSDAVFQDRADAGRQLAARLLSLRDCHPLVLGLARGGVAVAREIALALNASLDVTVARKLGAPGQPELGIGAVAPGGIAVVDQPVVELLGITTEQVVEIALRESVEMERRLLLYRGNRTLPDVMGRTVILVDDGLATGVTARAAIHSLRLGGPTRLILAAPVCAPETHLRLRSEVDDLICLIVPDRFRAVGLWYENFEQLTDDQVSDLLEL